MGAQCINHNQQRRVVMVALARTIGDAQWKGKHRFEVALVGDGQNDKSFTTGMEVK